MRIFFIVGILFGLVLSQGCGNDPTRQKSRPTYALADASTSTSSDDGSVTSTQTDATVGQRDGSTAQGGDADIIADGGLQVDASSMRPDVGICNPPLILCGQDCIDPNTDPMHCGACGESCDSAQGEVCAMGVCVDAMDCRIFGCTGLTYCDSASNRCEPGCDRDGQCDTNEVCDLQSHDCKCDSGFHDCSSVCVSDFDVASCGANCTPCGSDPNGMYACDGVSCNLACDMGYLECQGTCALCPSSPGIVSVGCDGTQCVAMSCAQNYVPCANGCCDFRVATIHSGTSGSTARESSIKMDGTRMFVSFGHNNPSTDSLRWALKDLAGTSGWLQSYVGFGGVESSIDIVPGGNSTRIAHYNHEMDWVSVWIGSSECIVEERGESPSGPVAFAIDSTGRNHIIYKSGTVFRRMRYAYGTGCSVSSWTKTSLGGNTANHIDLVTAADNQARTALAGEFLTRTAMGTWIRETIDSGRIASNIAIALDSFDNPHVSYYDAVNDDLWYAFRSGSTWTNILVADTGNVGEFNDIAIDSLGRIHIVYRDDTVNDYKLMYAYYDQTQWHFSEVVSGFTTGLNPSIAVDYQDQPHIVYSEGRYIRHAYLQ
jgi:hypothetical protein